MHLEAWFRNGVLPSLTRADLRAILEAIDSDDRRLVNGQVCVCDGDDVIGACLLGYVLLRRGVTDPVEIEWRFLDMASDGGLPCTRFLEWFDSVSREVMRVRLRTIVKRALKGG